MPRMLLVSVFLAMASPSFAEWRPPEKPDPSAILHDARKDRQAGRYQDALAKHVWYHENALKHDAAQSGVRRSFALWYWLQLGEQYPPALKKLEDYRQEARKQALASNENEAYHHFADFVAISKRLKKDKEIVDLFVTLDEKHPKSAKRAYHVVNDALIAAEKFELCGKYINGDKAIALEILKFEHHRELAKDPRRADPDIGEFGERTFRREAATLVAILVKCNRVEEAKRVAQKARAAWEDAELHAALEKALEGHFPDRAK
jgi:hypothetical protein